MKLDSAIGRILNTPAMRDHLLTEGAEPVGDTPDEFAKLGSSRSRPW